MTLFRSATVALALVALLLAAADVRAEDVEYRTGGKRFAEAWQVFYDDAFQKIRVGDPLVATGRPMVPAICEAVAHPDMKYRRGAIDALGVIGDRKALTALVGLLDNGGEAADVRGAALLAVYRIDRTLGMRYARQYRHADAEIARIADAILRGDRALLEPSEE